jgi:hypothetical protein
LKKKYKVNELTPIEELVINSGENFITTPFSTVMVEVKNALEQKGFRTNIPDSYLSSIF